MHRSSVPILYSLRINVISVSMVVDLRQVKRSQTSTTTGPILPQVASSSTRVNKSSRPSSISADQVQSSLPLLQTLPPFGSTAARSSGQTRSLALAIKNSRSQPARKSRSTLPRSDRPIPSRSHPSKTVTLSCS